LAQSLAWFNEDSMRLASMVTTFVGILAATLLLSSSAAEFKRSLRALGTSEADNLVGDGMSGALVGGLPDDDVLEEEDDEVDKALELDGVTSFHRSAVQKQKHAQNSMDDDEDVDDDKYPSLAVARQLKMHAEVELRSFQDDSLFSKTLASDVEKISNETQSPALAKFLGELKDNQRKYARDEYVEDLEKEIKKATKAIKKLEKESDEEDDEKKDDEKKDDEKKEKKKDKDKEEDDDDDKDEDETDKVKDILKPKTVSAGETFALGFFANVAMLACVFAMASAQNKTVANYTWFLIDQVVAIFLAVMHFQAFDSMLDFIDIGKHAVLCSVLHTLFLLCLVLGIAYYLQKRGDQNAVAVICGAGAHFVSFSAIQSGASSQNQIFMAYSYTVTMCLLGILTCGLGIGIIAVLIYKAKQRARLTEDDDFMDKSDDVENDAGATAFSVVFTMFIRYLLTGHHPVDDDTDFDHSAGQRTLMLVYAIICLIVAGVGINLISRKCPDEAKTGKEYAVKRVCNFFKTVLAMNTAWAFLYWGEWEFFEALYPKDPVKGRVMFAVVVTMIGGVLLLGLSRTPDLDKAARRTKTCALTALGLVIAFSWELTFDTAVEQMVEDAAHPVHMKVLACVVMLAIIVPVYIYYMKPIVKAHAIEG